MFENVSLTLTSEAYVGVASEQGDCGVCAGDRLKSSRKQPPNGATCPTAADKSGYALRKVRNVHALHDNALITGVLDRWCFPYPPVCLVLHLGKPSA